MLKTVGDINNDMCESDNQLTYGNWKFIPDFNY
jgi:hypothetical protein